MTDWLQPLERGKKRPKKPRNDRAGGRVTFERAVEVFIEGWVSPKTGQPYSRTSKKNVRGNLISSPCRSFREEHGVEYIDDWSDELAVEYLRWFQIDMGRDSATIKKVRSQLRQFAAFCDERFGTHMTDGVHLAGLRVSSGTDEHRPEEPALTDSEAQALMQAARSERDRLIIAMLLYTGMRPSELLALDEENLRFDREPPVVEIRGSVHRPSETKSQAGFRDIPLTIGQKTLPRLLKQHLQDRDRPAGATRLFLSTRTDEFGRATPLTLEGLKTMLTNLTEMTGIKCNAYRFRHTFCTWCADAGMHMLHLQQLLGHASNDMVAYYYRGRTSDAVLEAAAKIRF